MTPAETGRKIAEKITGWTEKQAETRTLDQAELERLAEKHPAPQEWYDEEDTEHLFKGA